MSEQETTQHSGFKALKSALEGSASELELFIEQVHVADLAHWLQDVAEEDARRAYRLLESEDRAELLQYANDPLRQLLADDMSVSDLVDAVGRMPDDEAVDLLALLNERVVETVLSQVVGERSATLRGLLPYPEDSAGGLMTSEYLAVRPEMRIGDVIKEIKAEEGPALEEGLGVFVVDEEGRPVGYVSDRDLLTHGIHTAIEEAMETELVSISAWADQEEVGQKVRKYGLAVLPVVNERQRLVGVIAAEDALEVMEEEAEEDILKLVGTSAEEQTRLPILTRVRHRLPLMGLTVGGGLLVAYILDLALEGTAETRISAPADLLRYLPIIIGLAGNVGIQSSTILVRAFATGEVRRERELSVLGTEVLVGAIIGLVCGAISAVVASLMEYGTAWGDFGLAVGLAIAVAVTWAAFLGCLVPILCNRTRIDPAVVAGPFLITLSDVSGSAIFMGVAWILLRSAGLWPTG